MAKIATPKAGTKSAAPARKRASRQPNNGKAATMASTRPTQTQASPKSAPRTKVTAAELLKRERKFQQQEQIAEATTTAEELAELQAQLAEFERARAALQRKDEKPSDQFVAQEREFQAEAERLERELVAKGEDVGRIAQFGLASRRIRDMAPPREGDYTPPPASEYFEAVHQLLAVTDHTVVSQKELDERRQNQKTGELVFCTCREHNQNSYQIRPREGKPFKIFGSYFSFDHYSQWQKGSRTTIWLASRTWFAIRDAEKAVRSEIRELEEKAVVVTSADVLNLKAEGIVAVPVVFRDGTDGGNLLLECSGNEVTLRAATHRGMQKILADAFGQSLTGEPRRDGKGVWFEGPKLLISILQSSRDAAEEREQSTLTAQKEDPSRAPSIQRLEELGEELKRSRRTGSGRKSSGKAETDGKAKARKPKAAPKIEEEEIAAVSDEPTAQEPPDEPDTASPTRSYGPDDNPESPFAALLKDVVAEDSQESEAEATK